LFRRKSDPTPSSAASGTTVVEDGAKPEGKGRPTPTRKEAEAAARARAKASAQGGRGGRGGSRAERAAQAARVREAMRTGDDRYMPARDKGPVRRFVRDWVDCRFTLTEIILPILIVAMFMSYTGSRRLMYTGEALVLLLILAAAVNLVFYRIALLREVRRRFPEATTKGLTYYMGMRMLQVRFLRMPKPQVKMGTTLPDTYR